MKRGRERRGKRNAINNFDKFSFRQEGARYMGSGGRTGCADLDEKTRGEFKGRLVSESFRSLFPQLRRLPSARALPAKRELVAEEVTASRKVSRAQAAPSKLPPPCS